MSNTGTATALSDEQRWMQWPTSIWDRLPLPTWAVMAFILALGAGSIALDTTLRTQVLGQVDPRAVREGIASLAVVVYIAVQLRILKRSSARWLRQLRPAVLIGDVEYEASARQLLCSNGRVELVLLGVATLLMVFFFVLPPEELRMLPHDNPGQYLAIAVIAFYYILSLWVLLILVYTGLRNARALGTLSNKPLRINVFDPHELLPFGRLSLLYSVAFAGVFLIPLLLLGAPTREGGGYLVTGLSVFSLASLFVPIWGVHRQILRARVDVLGQLSDRLLQVQEKVRKGREDAEIEVVALGEETEALVLMRNSIISSPTWPFRGMASVWRAILVVLSPLITFILSEVIRTYWLPFVLRP